MATFLLSPRARADLDDIWAYGADRWGAAKTEAYVREIVSICADLAAGHRIGLSAEYIRHGYLKYLVASHVIYFRQPVPAEIHVVRILHQRMDVAAAL